LFQHNLWSGGTPGLAAGTGDVYDNPQLKNPGGFLPTDYQLRTGSPAIDAGIRQGSPATDYFGDRRPSGSRNDIGADEFKVSLGNAMVFEQMMPLDVDPLMRWVSVPELT
jgi:hypothetical protein